MTSEQPIFTPTDHHYMQLALDLAQQGADNGEVPVGAVLVQFSETPLTVGGVGGGIDTPQGTIIAQGYNQPIATNDPTSHAEIVALRCACQQLQNYRLPPHTSLYVTLEPCTMCVGALIHARLHRLVFATREPRAGMVGSRANLLEEDFYNHQVIVESGLLAEHSSDLLKSFFKSRRKK